MKIAVIDYDMGNLASVLKALRFNGADAELISTPHELEQFSCALLPGVGNFGDGMENLASSGMADAIKKFAAGGNYLFGICLGMQMMLQGSEEAPGVTGLGIFPGVCRRFPEGVLKVPQISWNCVDFKPDCPLAKNLPDAPYFYFVHSYYVPLADYTAATTHYMLPFSSVIGSGNCFAVQFHPEKSQDAGLQLLKNFSCLAE